MKHDVKQPACLLEVLQILAPESSKNTLRSWLQSGRVSINRKPAYKANESLLPGQVVEIGPRVAFLRSLRILHQDDSLVVLEKPEGLLSVATDFETKATVHAYLKKQFHQRRVFPVHRLDRETSGVMLFAYTEKAREDLKLQFENHQIDKTYYAVVEGQMEGQGTWESYLLEDDFYYVKSTAGAFGKKATTCYEVLKTSRNRSLLLLKPKTGRKNQLRVHCSEAGHPMIGDKKYGAKTNPGKRVFLHAQKISFLHPTTQRLMTFEAPLPEIFSKIL